MKKTQSEHLFVVVKGRYVLTQPNHATFLHRGKAKRLMKAISGTWKVIHKFSGESGELESIYPEIW